MGIACVQGMRSALLADLEGIANLLLPLEQKGILKARTLDQLQEELPDFVVIEREVRTMSSHHRTWPPNLQPASVNPLLDWFDGSCVKFQHQSKSPACWCVVERNSTPT